MTDSRIFTLEEAERALPLVRRIVADVQEAFAAWREALARLEQAAEGREGRELMAPELMDMRREVDRRAERVEALTRELAELGCELKDYELGLVDFYALLEDRLVFLCWRAGEDRITHWHELEAGFAGRQPVDEALFPRTVP